MFRIPIQQPTFYSGAPISPSASPRRSDRLGHNSPSPAATASGGSLCVGLQAYPPAGATSPVGPAEDLAIGYDGHGVAFPAGIYWIDGSGVSASAEDHSSPAGWNGGLTAVPATLPSGYTLRNSNDTWNGGGGYDPNTFISQEVLKRWAQIRRFDTVYGWLRGQSECRDQGGSIYWVNPDNDVGQLKRVVANFPRFLWPDGGLWDYRWGPMNAGRMVDTKTDASGHSVPSPTALLTIHLGWSGLHVGWRNIRGCITLIDGSNLHIPAVTSCNLIVSRKVDWSIGASTSTPGTIDIQTIPLVSVSGVLGQTILQGDGGAIAPPDGTLGAMHLRIEITQAAGVPYTVTIPAGGSTRGYFSPRVDIPFPWTITGYYRDQDIVVPGGYLASLKAAPDLRPNGALTGAYQLFDPTVCGDSKSVIVSATLTAGSHTLDTDPVVFPTSWNNVLCLAPDDSTVFISGFTNSASFTAPSTGLYVFKIGFDLTTATAIKLKIS